MPHKLCLWANVATTYGGRRAGGASSGGGVSFSLPPKVEGEKERTLDYVTESMKDSVSV